MQVLKLILLLVTLTTAVDFNYLDREYTRASLELFRAHDKPLESFVFSPLSLLTALAILHEGAVGGTKNELTRLLLNQAKSDSVSDFYSNLARNVVNGSSEYASLLLANGIFVSDELTLRDEFKANVENSYSAKIANMNFNDKRAVIKEVNDFVSNNTRGQIKKALTEKDIARVVLILVNALSFIGNWPERFTNTQTRPFYLADNTITQQSFMSGEIGALYFGDSEVKVLSMPFARGANFSFVIISPRNSNTFENLRAKVTPESISKVLKRLQWTRVKVEIPKFKIDRSIDAISTLNHCGVKGIFTGGLTAMAEGNLFVSNAKHLAVIEVNGNGTNAAAVSVAVTKFVSMTRPVEKEFVANRPFLFAIVAFEKTIVFMGQFTGEN